jgi:hypothetical protein
LACHKEFDLQWTNIECSSFKPPQYLHASTVNLPNMEDAMGKTTGFWPELEDKSIL